MAVRSADLRPVETVPEHVSTGRPAPCAATDRRNVEVVDRVPAQPRPPPGPLRRPSRRVGRRDAVERRDLHEDRTRHTAGEGRRTVQPDLERGPRADLVAPRRAGERGVRLLRARGGDHRRRPRPTHDRHVMRAVVRPTSRRSGPSRARHERQEPLRLRGSPSTSSQHPKARAAEAVVQQVVEEVHRLADGHPALLDGQAQSRTRRAQMIDLPSSSPPTTDHRPRQRAHEMTDY